MIEDQRHCEGAYLDCNVPAVIPVMLLAVAAACVAEAQPQSTEPVTGAVVSSAVYNGVPAVVAAAPPRMNGAITIEFAVVDRLPPTVAGV